MPLYNESVFRRILHPGLRTSRAPVFTPSRPRVVPFSSVFAEAAVDVPPCFQKSRSLKRLSARDEFKKLLGLIMRRGLVGAARAALAAAARAAARAVDAARRRASSPLFSFCELRWLGSRVVKGRGRRPIADMLTAASAGDAVFSYYTYSVSKDVRKFSRGKSGKYVFIWKYVAPHKRRFLTLRWLVKEIKFSAGRALRDRIEQALVRAATDPASGLAARTRAFAHNYVFKNFKKGLAKSLRSAS